MSLAASMEATFIVAIDGPAGVGKSTLARRIAHALDIAYLDTGAMFRTIALGFEDTSEDIAPGELQERLAAFRFSLQGAGNNTILLCNSRAVGQEVRTEKAGMLAARVATWPLVRTYLKAVQQDLGTRFSLVVEGRDTGTVIFPAARCKIFLDASPEIRAHRRFLQLQAAGESPNLATLTEQIVARDAQDRTRSIAPLIPAEDAHIIDTSDKDINAVFNAIMEIVRVGRE